MFVFRNATVLLLLIRLLVLQRGNVVLEDLMLFSLVLHCSYKVLETIYVDLRVQDTLQVLILDLLGQDWFKLCLVRLPVEGLSDGCLICLVRELGVDFNELRIDLFLEARVVPLR